MTTTTISTATSYATDAAFRTANQAISTAIQAVGLIQTSDTGQINWTTVAKPGVAYTFAGYEMYRFNDSLQSTSPIYLKIEYGVGMSFSYSALAFTVGTGTDGAGNLTGNVSQRATLWSNTADGATRTSYFSGSTNRLCMVLWPPNSNADWGIFSLERTHDSSGTDTGAGAHIFQASTSGYGTLSQYLPLGTTTAFLLPYTTGGWYCSVPLVGSGVMSPNIYTYPIRNYAMYETLPIFNMLHYASTDITVGVQVSITGYDGTSRNYLAPGVVNTANAIGFVGSLPTVGLLMRYE
ncbi:MAG: hypothetical protein JHC33_13810 [Ignisphaera sp.]|nr:hypothetical protein [Ignisphaera sp.]